MRTVNRQYTQGVMISRCWFVAPHIYDSDITSEWHIGSYADMIPFCQMIADEGYPSISECASRKFGGAFDKQWAVAPPQGKPKDRVWMLFHESNPVGLFDTDAKSFLFARGSLTKTRRVSIEAIIAKPDNRRTFYAVQEQN